MDTKVFHSYQYTSLLIFAVFLQMEKAITKLAENTDLNENTRIIKMEPPVEPKIEMKVMYRSEKCGSFRTSFSLYLINTLIAIKEIQLDN